MTHLINLFSNRLLISLFNLTANHISKTVIYSPYFVAFLLHHVSYKSSCNFLQHPPLTNAEAWDNLPQAGNHNNFSITWEHFALRKATKQLGKGWNAPYSDSQQLLCGSLCTYKCKLYLCNIFHFLKYF